MRDVHADVKMLFYLHNLSTRSKGRRCRRRCYYYYCVCETGFEFHPGADEAVWDRRLGAWCVCVCAPKVGEVGCTNRYDRVTTIEQNT